MSESGWVYSTKSIGRSTETALLKIVNDLLTALDDNHISWLSLLDLSAAFDTIDHETLLFCLHHAFGISDTALSWFRSYPLDRTKVVSVNGNSSSTSVMKFGVPQGSVLGPILLVLHTRSLSDFVHHHSLSHHSFSDDNQLYKSGHILQLQGSFNPPIVVFLTWRTGWQTISYN